MKKMSYQEKNFAGKQITVSLSGKNAVVVMQQGFFCGTTHRQPLHRHKYAEIHFTAKGKSEYMVDGKRVTINTGEILVIPKGVYHHFIANEWGVRNHAFQISLPVLECRKLFVLPSVLEEILAEAQKFKEGGDGLKLSAYLGIILSSVMEQWRAEVSDIKDREFLIYEFLERNYASDVSLSELAKELNLSEKQTERVIKETTGNTFRQEIKKRRIEWAKQLLTDGKTTMDEVSRLVGYKSYSGFWKAVKADYKE